MGLIPYIVKAMEREDIGSRMICDIESSIVKDSFISTNFRFEHSGEWKSGCVHEFHERIVLYPEDHWIDSCGNGFSIEYFHKDDEKAHLVFGVRSPYTAPRNMEFTEELVSIMEDKFKSHGISYETLKSSDFMDSYWRIWTVLENAEISQITEKCLKLINEVFVEREKIVRPDYLIF